jgi:antitoxin MazE
MRLAMNMQMKVSKWGNSLAVRLPAKLVQQLGLKEGDFVGQGQLQLYKSRPKMTREEALEVMRNSRWQLPEDYKFDREEANSRG